MRLGAKIHLGNIAIISFNMYLSQPYFCIIMPCVADYE